MHIPTVLMWSITLLTAVVGMVFLFFPDRIARLEALLNAPWGNREVASLRFGLPAEQTIEQVLNRNILATPLVWDGWLRRHPRPVGAVLCLVAALLWWQM